MSLILDALRKLEREKDAASARRPGRGLGAVGRGLARPALGLRGSRPPRWRWRSASGGCCVRRLAARGLAPPPATTRRPARRQPTPRRLRPRRRFWAPQAALPRLRRSAQPARRHATRRPPAKPLPTRWRALRSPRAAAPAGRAGSGADLGHARTPEPDCAPSPAPDVLRLNAITKRDGDPSPHQRPPGLRGRQLRRRAGDPHRRGGGRGRGSRASGGSCASRLLCGPPPVAGGFEPC